MKKVLIFMITLAAALLCVLGVILFYFKYVSYPRDKDGMVQKNQRQEEVTDGVEISLDENPTTGFTWTYEVYPEGILKLKEDRYESDQVHTKEPIDGVGGTHYWKFEVVGKGTAWIQFICKRGDEVLYGSETIYQYQCDGTHASFEKKTITDDIVIESLSISWSGGFGTLAGTHPISIDFAGDKVSLNTHLDGYEGKEEMVLSEEIAMTPSEVEAVYNCVRDNLWDIQHHTKSNKDITDAANEYITINGMTYGGYAPEGDGFGAVSRTVYDAVGERKIESFRKKIYEWFEE